jgi:predicted transcriptional regulator YdeE
MEDGMSEVIHFEAGQIIGVRTSLFTIFNKDKYDSTVIPKAWQEFFGKAKHTRLGEGGSFYGASIPSLSLETPMDYFAGALVGSGFEIPDGFESVAIPGGDYLCFQHLGPIASIAASYAKAYMEFLPNSGREMRLAPHLEIYDAMKDPNSEDYTMLIGIPVV